ncbi:MAG: hypothetical protein ACQZ3N_04145 [cyanobacterium endosymbiont of Rhopalodia yunnanensis]
MWLLLQIKSTLRQVRTFDILRVSLSPGTGVYLPDYHFDLIFDVSYRVPQTAIEYAQALYRYCL